MDFLPAAIESSGLRTLPAFTENIVLATLWQATPLNNGPGFVNRSDGGGGNSATLPNGEGLYQKAQNRLALLTLPSSSVELFDPMRLFTNILAHAVVIQLSDENQGVEVNQQILSTALDSACEIVHLAKILTKTSLFKVSQS
jgi:hypothetical protein